MPSDRAEAAAKPVSLHLDWCSAAAARFACEHWHYAKSWPRGRVVKIGVWEAEVFIGAVLFTTGCAGVGALWRGLGLAETAVCELARVALCSHRTPVTRILAVALRLLRRQSPGLELVISYADPEQGHAGTIYRAGNWTEWGMSAPDRVYRFADGRIVHRRAVGLDGVKLHFGRPVRTRSPAQATAVIRVAPKHRFLYPLGPQGRRVIAELRAKQAEAADPAASGGAAPTRALQA